MGEAMPLLPPQTVLINNDLQDSTRKAIVLLFLLLACLARPVWGIVDESQPNVKPEYQRFFRYYNPGRSFPASLLQEHGINDDQVGRSYAVIAGVSHYPKLPADKRDLQPAKHDVDNLVTFLRDKQFVDEIIVLENDDVTLANFNYFLQVYLPKQMANKQDARFLFAYSGHGFDDSGSSYVLTSAASSMDDISSAIDLFQLKVAIAKVVAKALNSIVLINSCQGGAFLDRIPFGDSRLLLATFGAHAITAGAKGQFTYGSGAEHRGSYFFDEVIAGLSGGADFDGGGLITADQLYSFVRTEVQKDSNFDQDPQFGDIAPHLSRGSFFFVDPSPVPAPTTLPAIDINPNSQVIANTSEPPCGFPLFADYYVYALNNGLQDDLLRLVDADDWHSVQAAAGGSSVFFSAGRSFLGGAYPLTDDYATFDKKRTERFKSVFYGRSIQQAVDVMQLTMNERMYSEYGNCLSHQLTGPAVRAWAFRETINDIQLHIKYMGVPNVRIVNLSGTLSGGSVAGAPQGFLWQGALRLRTGEERVFMIRRALGENEVNIIIFNQVGFPSVALRYKRADGVLSLQLTGTAEVLRQASRRIEMRTPNNNENRGSCPNEVGHQDGKYCTSRTTLTLSATTHRFLRNARMECSGVGCPWTSISKPVISQDQSSVSAYLDNWGSDVQASLIVDEYERVSEQECGSTQAVPAVNDRPILFGISKDCVPFAAIKWVRIPSFSEGIVQFGSQSTGGQILMNGSIIQGDSSVIASYSLVGAKDSLAAKVPVSVPSNEH
jgi:hypothetical protein